MPEARGFTFLCIECAVLTFLVTPERRIAGATMSCVGWGKDGGYNLERVINGKGRKTGRDLALQGAA